MTEFAKVETLVEVIQKLSLAREMEAIMQIVRTSARNILSADGATFILKDQEFSFYADEDAIAPLWKGKRFPLKNCISGWVMLNKQAVSIDDVFTDERIPVSEYKTTFVKSLVMAPIRKLNPIGAIGVYWADSHHAEEEEIKLIQLLADSTSMAIENLNTHSRLDLSAQSLALQLQEKEKQALELQHEKKLLEETRFLWNEASHLAHIGGWNIDPDSHQLFWSKELFLIHDVSEDFSPELDAVYSLYEGESKEKLINGIEELLRTGTPFDFELELITSRLSRKFLRACGNVQYSEFNVPTFIYGTFQDITRQKKGEQKLLRSDAELKKVQEIAHIGSWYLDVETNEVLWTDELFKMYSFDPSKPVPPYTEHMKLFTPESWEILSSSLAKTRETGIPYELELNMVKEDGSQGWMWVRGEAVRDDKGNITGLWGAAQDITERKKPEQELAKAKAKVEASEARLLEAQRATKVGSWETDLSNLKVIWSNETYNIFDIHPETFQASHQAFLEFVHPEEKSKVNEAFVRSFDTVDYNTVEHRIITAEGNIKFVEERWKIVFDELGTPVKAVGTCQDISDRKHIEAELNNAKNIAEENEKQFRQLFENMQQGFAFHEMIYDDQNKPVDYRFLLINEAFEKLTGIDASKYLNNTVRQLVPDIEEIWIENYGKVAQTGKPLQVESYSREFERFYNVIAYSPKKDYFAVVFTDITKSKAFEREIIMAKEKAEESDRLKSAFLANMSHEIRTPMNGILGFTDLLLNPDLSSEQKENYIRIVHQSGQRMLNTVNDIVEISKIEAGLVNVVLKKINVNEHLEALVKFFLPEASKKGILLSIDALLPQENQYLETDESKLDSILTNLIKNAIKFTNAGKILIGCRLKDSLIEFYVSDTGIGIPKNRQSAIFERFIQAEVSGNKIFEGSGLGLAISKSYVEMLGGTIRVESQEGKGSNFSFTIPSKCLNTSLPNHPEQVSVNQPKESSGSRKLKFLIAEDDEISRKYISVIIKNLSEEILEAKTGEEALQICRDHSDIDLILMDIKMPVMDGYMATQEIRKFNKDVKIIAQTAYALSHDKEKAIEAGCNDYIAKPVRIQELKELINKYFGL